MKFLKKTRYFLEFLIVWPLVQGLGLLPLGWAVMSMSSLACFLGPKMAVHRRAMQQLDMVFPEKTDAERREIARAMWRNLGAVVAELAQIRKFTLVFANENDAKNLKNGQILVTGYQHVQAARSRVLPIIFFSAHYGNWELSLKGAAAGQFRLQLSGLYRAANNPRVDRLIQSLRRETGASYIPKGALAARHLLKALRDRQAIALLMDQHLSDGIAVDFFGRPAMTAPAIALLSRQTGAVVIPTRIKRVWPMPAINAKNAKSNGKSKSPSSRFELRFYPPLAIDPEAKPEMFTQDLLRDVNRHIETWIAEDPRQWLWLHQRWKKSGPQMHAKADEKSDQD